MADPTPKLTAAMLAACEWCAEPATVRYTANDGKWLRFSCTEPPCCARTHQLAKLDGVADYDATCRLHEAGFTLDGREASTETEQIHAAHPLRSGRHDLYAEAMRLVGERHAKADFVDLVCWLLLRAETADRAVLAREDGGA